MASGAWKHMTKLLLILLHVEQCTSVKRNVLFLVSDDMRPEIGAYVGPDFPSPVHTKMFTPHIDRLAARSLLLKQAHVQQALCGPSRSSLLTGRRPDTTHVYDLTTYWREVGGNFTTIPQFFKQRGYITQGLGKIFHPGASSHGDDPISWTKPYFHAKQFPIYDSGLSWQAVPRNTTNKYPLVDQQIASHAITALRQLAPKANNGQPFFLAVGFHRPHLPFQFPDQYLEYYPRASIQLPDNPYIPKNFPEIAWNQCGGLANFKDIQQTKSTLAFNTTVPNKTAIDLRRAYYSSISYIDSLIGEVIGELEELGLGNNTLISFWGDHGWQLGEHKEWCKQTNFDLATHAPMMVHAPGLTDSGIVTAEMTEFVDLFPTLVELAGFPALPTCPINSSQVAICTEGTSFVPLLKNPQYQRWKQRVFSQFPRQGFHTHSRYDQIMGYTMRTKNYRYTEWVRFTGTPEYRARWDKVVGIELYDHGKDPEENNNVAGDKAYKVTAQGLSRMLHQGWRQALPS